MTELDRSAHFWRKSTFSVSGECVEVAINGQAVLVRDSKDSNGPVLAFSGHAWRMFLSEVKAGAPDSESL